MLWTFVKTRRDETVLVLGLQAMSELEEEDDIVMRIPVLLRRSGEDAPPLSLFQYPLRPRWRPYNTETLQSARVRPVHSQVEMQLGPETGSTTFDVEPSDSPLPHITLASIVTPPKTSYAIGRLVENEDGAVLTLAPLESCLQLRPSFAQIDKAEEEANKEVNKSRGADSEQADGAPISFAPVFRAALTEREIEMRRNSHAYMVEQQEAEAWSEATLFASESGESSVVRKAVFGGA